MRFASVLRDGEPAAVAMEDEIAIPLTNIEIGGVGRIENRFVTDGTR